MSKHAFSPELVPSLPDNDHASYVPVDATSVTLPNTTSGQDRPIMGQSAVWSALELDNVELYAQSFAADGANAAHDVARLTVAELAARVAEELDHTREQLSGLEPAQHTTIEAYLTKHLPDVDTKLTGHDSRSAWLADKENGATNEELLGLLKRHYHEVISARQDPMLMVFAEKEKVQDVARQMQGIREGWISKNAHKAAIKLFNARVVVGDVWDTIIHGRAAFLDPEATDVIVIAQGGGRTGEHERVIFKELHDVFGHEAKHLEFACGLPNWEEEALAEHTDLSLTYGRPDLMHPQSRANAGVQKIKRYNEGRILYDMLLRLGDIRIAPRYVTRAYTSGSLNSIEWKFVDKMMDESWGVKNMRAEVTAMVQQNREIVRQEHPGETVWKTDERALNATCEAILRMANDRRMAKQQAA